MKKQKEYIKNLEQIEKELETLPKGYISKKIIYGKERYYLQWNENGKKKSKYIKYDELEKKREEIKRRQHFENLKKEILNYIKSQSSIDKNETEYKCKSIIYGETLRIDIEKVKKFKKRIQFNKMKEFLNNDLDYYEKVLILYGIRRSGKTTLIKQSILDLNENDFNKTALIKINNNENLSDLNYDLKKLESKGFKFIFIDEITKMNDFIDGASLLSDVYASRNMKIVLSGTDSLGFKFAEGYELFDRCIMLHTTYISYKEFEEVLDIKGIDKYIEYGGTMSISGKNYNEENIFNSDKRNEYIDSAIANNIQHSLKCCKEGIHFRSLEELYNNNELTNLINRVVEDINHKFTIDIIEKEFKSTDLTISRKNLRKDKINPNDDLDKIDIKGLTLRLKNDLEILNKNETSIKIKQVHIDEIKEYLKLLDIIQDINIKTITDTSINITKSVFLIPGLRYSQAKSLIMNLFYDNYFISINPDTKNRIIERILNDVKGRMMEEIIILETMNKRLNCDVFKLIFDIGEYDMVIRNRDNNECELYEIKHSQIIDKNQYRFLLDKDKLKLVNNRIGKVISKNVLYRGKDSIIKQDNIHYLNVEKYLKSL